MKNRFSSLDIMCMVKELQSLVGMRVNQVYDIDNKTYLIKLQLPEKKSVLLIESGVRLNATTFDWPKNDHPSGFSMKLRKHLRNKRLEYLKQLGKDRIVDLQFGSGEAAYHIFIELFDKGNIILTDHSLTIVNLLRFHNEGENKCMVRELYSLDPKRKFDNSNLNMLDVLVSSKEGDTFRKMLMPFIDYGPACLEHILSLLGYTKGAKVKQCFNQLEASKFVEDFYSILNTVEKVCNEPGKGYIFKKKDLRANGEEFFSNVEFHPFYFNQFSSDPFEEYENFNSAVDEFFSQMETQKIDMKALHEEKAALKKVEKIRTDQAARLKDLDKKQQVDTLKAELITYNIDKVEEAITTIRSALAAQMSWNEISELVERAKNDPIGSLISQLKFETNCITLKLENPFSDEGDDSGVLVDVDLDLSAYGNVKKYYSDKKSASTKQQKTLQAQGIALKSAEKKIESVLKDIQMTASITKSRLVFWFEKFFWFISSENYLVIGSRDKIQAEMIVRRYMKPEDIFVHTDGIEASCFVIKNPTCGPMPPKTLNEAGSMAVCFSSAWNIHIITNAWWVKGEQVTSVTAFTPADPFYRISGQKNYLPPGQLAIGFGFIFYIDESSVQNHLGERQVKYIDSDTCVESLNDEISELQTEDIVSTENNTLHDDADQAPDSDNTSEDENNDNPPEVHDDSSSESDEPAVFMSKDIDESIANDFEVSGEEDSNEAITENVEEVASDDVTDKIKKGKGKIGNRNQNRAVESNKKQKDNDQNSVKRGQRSKLKKIREKYKDQDEEEKQLRMAILQSAGSKKENSRKSLKQAKEQLAQEKRVKRIPKAVPTKTQSLNKDDVEEVNIPVDTDLSMLSRLTGLPQASDKIIFALPVVAPYNTLVVYKYKVKMIPGTSKRGKSARNALNIFLNSKESNEQEKAMMKSVNDQILCRDLPGKVKLSVRQATAAKLKKKR